MYVSMYVLKFVCKYGWIYMEMYEPVYERMSIYVCKSVSHICVLVMIFC